MIFIAILFSLNQSFAADLENLRSFNVDTESITVSGVSSGAFMAVQMHVAYSGLIAGAGSVAGGTYWCAKGESGRAQSECMGSPNNSSVEEQIKRAEGLAAESAIDPLENLRSSKVYIYHSKKDSIIHPSNSQRLIEFYKAFMDTSLIKLENTLESAHGFPTLASGAPCGIGMPPWLLKCDYDLAGEILKNLYGELSARGIAKAQNLHKYAQKDFGDAKTPLFENGWVYVPDSCQEGKECRLHVALHGCMMNPDFIKDQFANLAGYNDWAETNKIIVLYPQSAKLPQSNPYACWDWFGFTGRDYVSKTGPQMVALKKMIDRVTGQ